MGDSLEIENHSFKNLRVRFEVRDRTGLLGRATRLQFGCRDPSFVALAMDLPPLPYLDHHPLRKGIDHGSSDTVQTARHLVGFLVELSPGVQHGHDHFDARLVFDRMHADGYPVSVVLYHDAAVRLQGDFDAGTAACHRLVDAVVDDLLDQLVQAVLPCIADVHRRPLANPLKPLENLDRLGGVRGRLRLRHANDYLTDSVGVGRNGAVFEDDLPHDIGADAGVDPPFHVLFQKGQLGAPNRGRHRQFQPSTPHTQRLRVAVQRRSGHLFPGQHGLTLPQFLLNTQF